MKILSDERKDQIIKRMERAIKESTGSHIQLDDRDIKTAAITVFNEFAGEFEMLEQCT